MIASLVCNSGVRIMHGITLRYVAVSLGTHGIIVFFWRLLVDGIERKKESNVYMDFINILFPIYAEAELILSEGKLEPSYPCMSF